MGVNTNVALCKSHVMYVQREGMKCLKHGKEMQILNNLLPKNGLCLHGTVLYVCMYLSFLYEVSVFYFIIIILLRCSDLRLLF